MWFLRQSHQDEDEEALLQAISLGSERSTCAPSDSCDFIPISRSTAWLPSKRKLNSTLRQALIFLLPSFSHEDSNAAITTPTTIDSAEKQAKQNANHASTEYLDGVRGLASFIVFVFHWTHLHYSKTNTGYGATKHSSLWQLPIIRLIYSGAAMVSVFFVCSGYVLTHRFIQKMHRRDYTSLYSSLTSLAFRRALRLFLPSLASCILAYLCTSLGFISLPKSHGHKAFHHGIWALLKYIDKEFAPWTWDAYMDGFYNAQLWSIALEYRGSMVVFLCVLALAKTRTILRVLVETAIVIHAFGHKRWDVALFIAGMLVAELDVLVRVSGDCAALVQRKRVTMILFTSMAAGLWLSGFPRDGPSDSWGYGFLDHVWPFTLYRRRFWLAISAIMIIAPMPHLPIVQKLFNTAVMRYLGKISFALYLIHGLTNRTIGVWLMEAIWVFIGKEGYWQYMMSYITSTLIYMPLVIWWSDIFWRAVDLPSTRFAKWLELKCESVTST